MLFVASSVMAESMGNPRPGYPHDTIIIHVQKAESGPKNCDGGHSLFLRHVDGVIPEDTYLNITMIDWVQVDNDDDGLFDEDPEEDGIDEDGDGLDGEDGLEPGAVTTATDCDSWGDNEVSLQIRDTDPRKGYVSTQEWFMRMIGKPEQEFAFTTFANQTVQCAVIDPDEVPDSGDEYVECVSGTSEDWIELASFNLAIGGCVKQVKLGGKNPGKGGGKTNFCDITEGFLVDVDTDGDDLIDLWDQFIFSISCLDNLDTIEIDESLFCPLSSLIWEVDEATSKAKAQIFVGHTGTAIIKKGKIK